MKINLTELLRNSPGSPTALSAVLLAFFAPPLAAQEADPEAGRAIFTETAQPQCALCHVLAEAEAQGKVGPNLYGVAGRTAGTYEDFSYSDLMIEAGEKGLEWNEADFAAYVADPTGFLREYTGESSGRGKMTFKLPKEEDAMDVWAYLVSVGGDGGGS